MGWLWDKIKGGFEWGWGKICALFSWIWDVMVQPLLDWVGDTLNELWEWIVNEGLPMAMEGVCNLLSAFGLDVNFQKVKEALASLLEHVHALDWILPVSTILTIFMGALAIKMTIRLVRLVIWLCPFIG